MRFKGIVIGMKNIKGIAIKKRVAKVFVCVCVYETEKLP